MTVPIFKPGNSSEFTLADLINTTGEWIDCPRLPIPLAGVSLQSNRVHPGDLFVALPGAHTHGGQYASEAIARGASAILTDPTGQKIMGSSAIPVCVHPHPRAIMGTIARGVYGNPDEHLHLIAITGTSGKTTTSYFLETVLRAAGHSCGLIGTVGVRINGTFSPTYLTTPEAPDLYRLFAQMRDQGVDTVVMEVSSHAIALHRIADLHFHRAAFTNLSRDHLDFHSTMEEYFTTKAQLFDPASPLCATESIICIDDSFGYRLAQIAAHPITVSTDDHPATWRAHDHHFCAQGSQQFILTGPDQHHYQLSIGILGSYNISNCTIAVALGASLGIDPAHIIPALATTTVPGRLEPIDRGQDFLALVDYAHKPGALQAVLSCLRQYCSYRQGRLAVVFGAGGDRDQGKRAPMGHIAAQYADLVIITDDNPRSEDPAYIRQQILAGIPPTSSHVHEIPNRAEAIRYAIGWAQCHDVVVIAGKGHETGQIIAGQCYDFDDRVELARALEEQR